MVGQSGSTSPPPTEGLQVVVEPTLEPLQLSGTGHKAKTICGRMIAPFKFVTVVCIFLTILLYMLGVSIFQGLGMLAMSLTMPSFMRLVYPSRLGSIHTWALGLYRRRGTAPVRHRSTHESN